MKNQNIIKSADSIIAGAHEIIDNLRPAKEGPSRLRVALFLTIAEQFEASVHLFRVKMVSHAAVHVRAMLEALIYMNLLEIKDGYIEQMLYKQLKSQKKVIETMLNSNYISHITDDDQLAIKKSLAECTPKFEEKHQAGIRSKQISEELLEAGLSEFIAPYLMLCGFSHNDINVLAMRHQGDDAMTYKAPIHEEISDSIFFISIRIIMQATEPLPRIALFPEGRFESGFQKMNKAWGEALAE